MYVYIAVAFWLFGCVSCTAGYVVARGFERQAWAERPYERDLDLLGSLRGVR